MRASQWLAFLSGVLVAAMGDKATARKSDEQEIEPVANTVPCLLPLEPVKPLICIEAARNGGMVRDSGGESAETHAPQKKGRPVNASMDSISSHRWFRFSGQMHVDLWRILPPAAEHAIVLLILSNSLALGKRYTRKLPSRYFADTANLNIRAVQQALKDLIDLHVIAEKTQGSRQYEALVKGWAELKDAPRRKNKSFAGGMA